VKVKIAMQEVFAMQSVKIGFCDQGRHQIILIAGAMGVLDH